MPRIAIIGAGAAGLSLATHLHRAGIPQLELTLVDRDFTPVPDRTWCFWDEDSVLFPEMIRKSWTRLRVVGSNGSVQQESLSTLTYRMAESARFSLLAQNELRSNAHIGFVAQTDPDFERFDHDWIFQSIRPRPRSGPWLKQHFLGWEIRAGSDIFDPEVATIMDFGVDQRHGFAFMYVLPTEPTQALVEFTLFSDHLIPMESYRDQIRAYLAARFPSVGYDTVREEFGVIPMVPGDWNPGSGRMWNIGAVAGLAKASTGYTFSRIQRDSGAIARSLAATGDVIRPAPSSAWKTWMDAMILRIIREDPARAIAIFEHLFRVNGIESMLRFLDEQTTLRQDLAIMASVPSWWEFVKRIGPYSTKTARAGLS